MNRAICHFIVLANLCSGLSTASAHYLWTTVDSNAGKFGTANIYFEESPHAGDGHYLDHFTETSKLWIRTIDDPQAKLIKTVDVRENDRRWLSTKLAEAGPRSIDCYGKFGVYRYGKTNVLLHYYARYLDVDSHEELHELGRAEQMDLDIVPHDSEDKVELRVLWQGSPAADRTIHIRGPKKFRMNLKTDQRGKVRFKPVGSGQYTFRTSVEEDIAGQEGDESYSLIRHNGTLIMQLPLEK